MTDLITHTTAEQIFCELVERRHRAGKTDRPRYYFTEPVGPLEVVAAANGCSLMTARRAVKKFRDIYRGIS
jgi:hypothetical protein